MAYAIKYKKNGSYVYIGCQEEVEDSDGTWYDPYWYIIDKVMHPSEYDSYIDAEDELGYACMDGSYNESDYEIMEV